MHNNKRLKWSTDELWRRNVGYYRMTGAVDIFLLPSIENVSVYLIEDPVQYEQLCEGFPEFAHPAQPGEGDVNIFRYLVSYEFYKNVHTIFLNYTARIDEKVMYRESLRSKYLFSGRWFRRINM